MIRTIRAYFLSRLLREKILLLGFILIGTLWWLSAFSTRAGAFWRDQRSTTRELRNQQQWLDNKDKIEVAAQNAARIFESAKTLDRTRLQTAVTQAATEAGLKGNQIAANSAGSQTNGQFTIHSVDFTARDADYETLQKFYLKLHQRAPYIGIEQFTLSSQRSGDRSKLTLGLRVSAVEIPR